MHQVIIGVVCFVAGGGVGFLIGRALFKRKCKACTEKHNQEFLEMDKYYEGRHPEKKPFISKSNNEPGDVSIQSIDCKYEKPLSVDYTSYYDRKVGDGVNPDPADYESPPDEDPEDVHARDVGEFITLENEKDRSKPPRPIKAEEFGDREDRGYSTMELTYYQGNDVLVASEQRGEVMIYPDEVGDWVGDALTKFGFTTNNEDVLYVRNYSRMVDYEIAKARGSFGEN